MKWLAEHDAVLADCLARGMSHSEAAAAINERFQTKRSRSSCISRAERLGIKSKLGQADGACRVITINKARAPARRSDEQKEDLAEPLHLALTDLSLTQCRYPYGDGPFTFCGCLARAGSSYCTPHFLLAMNDGRRPHVGARELRIRKFVRNSRELV